MKPVITFFILTILFSFNGLAHENCPSELASHPVNYQNAPALSLDLFQKNKDQKMPSQLKNGLVLNLNQQSLSQVLNQNNLSLKINMPSPDGEVMSLELVQTNPLSKNFKVTGSISGKIDVPLGKYYEGTVNGIAQSIVTASFSESGVRLLISTTADGNMVIGKMNRLGKNNTPYIFYKERDLIDGPKFACQTPDFDPAFEVKPSTAAMEERSMMCLKPIDVYIECDHLMYQDFGGNIANISNYVVSIFHTTAALFRAEEVAIQMSEIFIWENEDPYTDDDAVDALTDFKDQLSGDFNGKIAHLLSPYKDETGFAPLGGLAHINSFCNPNLAVGYSNIQLDFNGQTLPAQSYDVLVMTHEIGHNLGSKHTHACVWGPNEDEALDDCFETEGDCPLGPTPTNGGTIMSYCHVSPSGINLTEGFGLEPGNKIRTQISNAPPACLSVGTANFQASIQPLSDTHIEEGGMVTLVAVPTSADYYYQWYRNGEILTGIIFPSINVFGEGSYTVSIVHNGCTEEAAAVEVTVGTFEASVSCSPDCSACVGQSIVLETNISGATYQWSTGESTETIEVSDSGTYTVTVTNGSASSVATSTVSFNQEMRTDNPEICEGEVYMIGNSTYDETGTYTNVVTENNGCTVEVITNLTVHSNTEESNTVQICQGESHTVEGSVYTQTGNYSNERMNANGCTHTIFTNLRVLPTYMPEVEASICEGGSYTVGNSTYTAAGTYEDRLTASNGCDSIITTILTISDNYETNLNYNLCAGETIEINGTIYDETSIFTLELVATDGCDSLVHVDLVVSPRIETLVERCTHHSTEAGTFEETFPATNGCDSIVYLTVYLVTPPVFLTVDICTGEEYDFFGNILTETGNYAYEEPDDTGCPIETFLYLTVNDVIMTEETVMLCYGGVYENVIYTESADLGYHDISVNGCDSSGVIHIIVAEEIQIEADFSEPSEGCDGEAGSVNLMVSGGSGDYEYLWSNGETGATIENLSFGELSVTVTDSDACTTTETWTIEGTTQLAVDYEATMIACRGDRTGAIDITIISGTPPYNMFWSNGPTEEDINELQAGSYTLFLNDANGCSLDTTIVITQPETTLTAEVSTTSTSNDNEDGTATITPMGGASPYTYLWSNGETTATIENLAAGTYSIEITDANACTITEEVVIEQVSGIHDMANITDFAILPNPNNGLFNIHLNLIQSEDVAFEIYNVMGQRVYDSADAGQQFLQAIDLQTQASGIYVLVIKTETWRLAERLVITANGVH